MALHLGHGVHGDAHHDEERGAAEIEWRAGISDQDFRQHADSGEVEGADHSDPGEHVVDIFGGALAGPDAGQEAAILLQIVGRVLRIEDDRRIEEGEEDDQRHVDQDMQRLTLPG